MKKLLFIALLASPLSSQACSFAPGFQAYTPAAASFEAKVDGERYALLPAPGVRIVRLARGTAAPGGMCGGIGQLTLELDWPASSVYKLGEVGFYFRVLGGAPPDRIFPLAPVTGTVTGQRARFFFVWQDGHPSVQQPLNLDVEVFAVNKGLEIGAPRRFHLTDEAPAR